MQKSASTLVKLLHHDFGHDFPVVSGTRKEDSPLVITELRDYVAVEYAVVRHIMQALGEEWKLAEQRISHGNGRTIERMVVHAKPAGAPDWTGSRRFHFDITAGWRASERKMD